VGYIGLGVLGMPMARCLVRKGFAVTAFDVRRSALDEIVAIGGVAASTCRDVAVASDVVISMVRDVPQTEAVLFGPDGVLESLRPNATVILTSTLSPEYCRDVYARCRERNVQVIDAPVTGTRTARQAEDGEVTLLIGGDDDAVERCRPIFDALALHAFHLGPVGQGQSGKLVTILATLVNEVATYEALTLGLQAGVDLETQVRVLDRSTGYNWWIRAWDFRMEIMERARRQYQSTPAPTQSIGEKDRLLALEMAAQLGAQTPMLELVQGMNTRATYSTYFAEYARLVEQRILEWA
jgi:3-hydroxyisobutyrate dehydrogenase-like beta-hydroxyacid dehydrogenase